MPYQRLEQVLSDELSAFAQSGRRKGRETVFTGIVPAAGGKGPRYLLAGEGEKPFLRMNSNGYLGLAMAVEVRAAGDAAVRAMGTGPGAVRFISGTWQPHIDLETQLAHFHGRAAAMIFNSAYAAMVGILPPLITPDTAVISDELNHNCIINAMRLARSEWKYVYRHLDLEELAARLMEAARTCRRAVIVTDGVFSMRGDHAPLDGIMVLARAHDDAFAEGVLVVVDDSHGVGAYGAMGRGTEEVTQCGQVDILVGTLGKAFGVNGGYVAASETLIDYLRETAASYIYSNPIGPGEAAAASAALAMVDGTGGRAMLAHLRQMTARFEAGLSAQGLETIPGVHPVVPLMIRDTARTSALVSHLRQHGILATGLNFPVVPKGDEEIRFQISADHTAADIDEALAVLQTAPTA
ncbi:MAG: aminotransferase class I/II-fold pyridoxal phosphate-dependent enzyme [Alphaproteobacteria bacterium]|nr:aminotransferase class I/II-fold pyridoxal phosphate-dependent enzyme [Alphaproteobacteria bacterium]